MLWWYKPNVCTYSFPLQSRISHVTQYENHYLTAPHHAAWKCARIAAARCKQIGTET